MECTFSKDCYMDKNLMRKNTKCEFVFVPYTLLSNYEGFSFKGGPC